MKLLSFSISVRHAHQRYSSYIRKQDIINIPGSTENAVVAKLWLPVRYETLAFKLLIILKHQELVRLYDDCRSK